MAFNINFSDLNELTLDSVGAWPMAARMGVIAACGIIVLVLGFWGDTRLQLEELDQNESHEMELKTQVEFKQQQAANLNLYQQQLAQMNKTFSELLKQLPSTTEVPGLLEDISKQGLASGLEFRLIKPLAEVPRQFYVELPIDISVNGTYHQIATFISNVSQLPRIVTFNDFTLKRIDDDTKKDNTANNNMVLPGLSPEPQLSLQIVASIYRYVEDGEGKP